VRLLDTTVDAYASVRLHGSFAITALAAAATTAGLTGLGCWFVGHRWKRRLARGEVRRRRASVRGFRTDGCTRQAPSRSWDERPDGGAPAREAQAAGACYGCQCGEDGQPGDAIGGGSPERRSADPRAGRPTRLDQVYVGGVRHGHHCSLCRADERGSATTDGNPADEIVDARRRVAGPVEPDTVRHDHEQPCSPVSESSKPRKRA
jgi:hypothetical protein